MKSVLLSLLFLSTAASAATFKEIDISKLKSKALQKIAKVAEKIAADEATFGDRGRVVAVSLTRKESEENINTIKQLNFAKGGLNSDDGGGFSMDGQSPDEIANYMFPYRDEIDDAKIKAAYGDAVSDLAEAIYGIQSLDILIFGANHADEDGSWEILNFFDIANDQILFIRIGASGT